MNTEKALQEKHRAFEALLHKKQEEYDRLTDFQKDQLDSINGDDLDKSDMLESPTENLMREVRLEGNNLDKLRQEIDFLNRYESFGAREEVGPASLVDTSMGKLLVAVPENKFETGKESYTAISTDSPIYGQLQGKKAGDEVQFNGQTIRIRSVV
ncbi:MAG TPA: hypothetical protein DCG19_14180 [Cryomorphaceae bacterium]|nr:hypothetical protein [Owenweeksia sp.]HAD98554.1 hypothetical protein [Cryomorphaceae bacterium]HBF20503.1 hypothetical protein [Cryomorphaceae bacterium]|tara:strand:- start:376 stop:840 length:465 start_codon:yes stop_codon:yes gene_type:complete